MVLCPSSRSASTFLLFFNRVPHCIFQKAKFASQNKAGEVGSMSRSPDQISTKRSKARKGVRSTTPKMKVDSPVSTMKTSSPVAIPGRSDGVSRSLFAGAKFNDPPSPKSLPKPPTHWMQPGSSPLWEEALCIQDPSPPILHDQISLQLKTLLKVEN